VKEKIGNAAIHLHWNVNHRRSRGTVEARYNLFRTLFFHVSENNKYSHPGNLVYWPCLNSELTSILFITYKQNEIF
jgi:hypothetical protein